MTGRTPVRRAAVRLTLLLAAPAAGCRGRAAAPAPERWPEDHCWWAVARSPLSPDTVAARFAQAFTALGLASAATRRLADTAWAAAGPTPIARGPAGARYASRIVAYRRGDSTHFRHFVAVLPPAGGWARPADTAGGLGGRSIGFCGDVTRAAVVRASLPREPTGEEGLRVWTRAP